jgi:hypothetical protein
VFNWFSSPEKHKYPDLKTAFTAKQFSQKTSNQLQLAEIPAHLMDFLTL